jgi:hypothetical protein
MDPIASEHWAWELWEAVAGEEVDWREETQ